LGGSGNVLCRTERKGVAKLRVRNKRGGGLNPRNVSTRETLCEKTRVREVT